jgi:uncharacterized protein (TIGR00730 family)
MPDRVDSVCVYCSASNQDPVYASDAAALGAILAAEGLRLVYGGGGVGLMGACARAAHAAGGRVLGVMPEFLRQREALFDEVETIVVRSMHERKLRLFDEADAFVVLPGGIGTLEEIIELLSWRRMDLHKKPIVFQGANGFWRPLFDLFDHTIRRDMTPAAFATAYRAVETVEEILPAVRAMALASPEETPALLPRVS